MCRVVVKINKDREKLAQESCNDGSNSGDYDFKSNGEKGDKESGGFEGGDDKEGGTGGGGSDTKDSGATKRDVQLQMPECCSTDTFAAERPTLGQRSEKKTFEVRLVGGFFGLGITLNSDELEEFIVIKKITMFSPAATQGILR